MAAPYTQEFTFPDGLRVTSIVLDQQDFDALCDELRGIVMINNEERTADEQIAALKQARHIPMMKKGTKTEKFFTRFGIQTEMLSVIVRGAGSELLKAFVAKLQPPEPFSQN